MEWIAVKGLKKDELPKGEVLVTNNPTKLDSYGNMQHIWVATLYVERGKYTARFIPFGVMGSVTIQNVTHYCVPKFEAKK